MQEKNTKTERMEKVMNFDLGVAITSRIRLARNFAGCPFMQKLSHQEDIDYLTNSLENFFKNLSGFSFNKLKSLNLNRCSTLLERHLISKELIENRDISCVASNEDDDVVVMLFEEDHLRLQSIVSGFSLEKCFEKLLKIDKKLLSSFDIAFDESFGFLTSSPANLGTGMRASLMVFIPALEKAGRVEELYESAKKNGLTFRGIYGEGSKSKGSLYQISNQNSLGLNEEEIIDKVNDFFIEISRQEIGLRKELLANNYAEIKNQVLRAYGVLKHAYSLTENEMIELLSLLKIGQLFDFLKIKNEDMFMKLYYHGSESGLLIFAGKEVENIDVFRAEYISKRIASLVVLGG